MCVAVFTLHSVVRGQRCAYPGLVLKMLRGHPFVCLRVVCSLTSPVSPRKRFEGYRAQDAAVSSLSASCKLWCLLLNLILFTHNHLILQMKNMFQLPVIHIQRIRVRVPFPLGSTPLHTEHQQLSRRHLSVPRKVETDSVAVSVDCLENYLCANQLQTLPFLGTLCVNLFSSPNIVIQNPQQRFCNQSVKRLRIQDAFFHDKC